MLTIITMLFQTVYPLMSIKISNLLAMLFVYIVNNDSFICSNTNLKKYLT